MTGRLGTSGSGEGRDVLSLLMAQRDLCHRLGSYAEKQRSLITAGEPERLLGLLGERQSLLEEMCQVGERLRSYQKDWPTVRAAMAARDAAEADRLIGEVNRLLASILNRDEADAQLLCARKNATAEAMRQVSHGRQAGMAYAAAAPPEGTRVEWVDE